MARAKNELTDVFKHIDMSGGPDACWPWKGGTGGRDREPRPYFTSGGKRYIAYRLVYSLVTGRVLSTETVIRHSCDNGRMPVGCCNPRHLSEGSVQDNSNDMKSRERHGLPHHVVRAIRKLGAQGRKHADIAELYGISRENVTAICNYRTYKEVEDDNGTEV